jgi:hypothetical protein
LKRLKDVLEAVQSFASSVDEQFDGVDRRFDHLESYAAKIEAIMVAKDHLDDKLSDLDSDIRTFVKGRVPGWSEA